MHRLQDRSKELAKTIKTYFSMALSQTGSDLANPLTSFRVLDSKSPLI